MNAIELLEADHELVEGLFQEVEDSDSSEHTALFDKIKRELEVHAHIERQYFTRAFRSRETKLSLS